MPTLSAGDLTLLRSRPETIRRHLSIAPRTAVFAARVNGTPTLDAVTGGITAIPFDTVTVGAYTDALAGLTLDVGSTAGGHDVGKVRLRKDASASLLYVAETAPAQLQVGDNYYLTVRNERRIWQRLPYLLGTKDGTGYYNSFQVFKDYDETYTFQQNYPAALANAEGQMAGWVDEGQTYRTVRLDSSHSEAVGYGRTITARNWLLDDGSFVAGYSFTDAVIEATFPVGFRYVTLIVTDETGVLSYHYFPIFVHDVAHPPLDYSVGFKVDRDDTVEGREMSFTIWGADEEADESVIPEGSLVVYWEEALFDEQSAPTAYRREFMGWVARDSSLLQLQRSQYSIDVIGPAGWLDRIDGPQESILGVTVPATWYEMPHITDDRLIAYLLRWHTTFLEVSNLYLSGVTNEWSRAPINRASIWQQVKALASEMLCSALCDSGGSLHLVRQACYLEDADRDARAEILTLGPQDWTDEEGLTASEEKVARTGLVIANGFSYDGSTSTPLRAHAPGLTPGYGVSQETMQGALCLPAAGAQTQLNQWAGHHFARVNNPCADQPITLIGNLDIAEPAWGEWIRLAYSGENVRGTTINARYLLKQVSIQHSNERGVPPKRITWTLDRETQGEAGMAVPVASEGANLPPYTNPSDLFPGVNYGLTDEALAYGLGKGETHIARVNKDGTVSLTSDFDTLSSEGGPTWADASLGVSGTPLGFVAHAFSPKYLGTGTTVNGWLVTSTNIYYITDLADVSGRVVTSQHTFAEESEYRTIQTDRGIANWVLVASMDSSGVKVCRTTNGVDWTETLVSSDGTGGGEPSIFNVPEGMDWAKDFDYRVSNFGSQPLWVEGTGLVRDPFARYSPTPTALLETIYLGFEYVCLCKYIGYDLEYPAQTDPPMTWNWDNMVEGKNHYHPWPDHDALYGLDPTPETPPDYSDDIRFGQAYNCWPEQPTSPAGTYGRAVLKRIVMAGIGTDPFPSAPDYEPPAVTLTMPQLYVSGKTAGLCFVTAFNGTVGALYRSPDYGENWTRVTTTPAVDLGDYLGGGLLLPWHNNDSELIAYWGKLSGGALAAYRTEADGATMTDITPTGGYGPNEPRCWGSSAQDRNHVALMGTNKTTEEIAGFLSGDGGDTWDQILAPAARALTYTGIHMGDDPDVLYFWGPLGVAYSEDGGVTIDDRNGNLVAADECLAIVGW